KLDKTLLADISENKRLQISQFVERLQFDLQQLKQENSSKDTEIYYLKNLIEAKEQAIQNLKRLVDFLEKQVK
ncbi:MAG: hypothetical protein ACPG49_13655, partial [Chitinophagales bacterium]